MTNSGEQPVVHQFISLGEPTDTEWQEFISQIPKHQWDAGEWDWNFHITDQDENVWTLTHIGAAID